MKQVGTKKGNALQVGALRRLLPMILTCLAFSPVLLSSQTASSVSQASGTQQKNMRLVGHHDLQGRSAYQPIIHRQGDQWIAYIGTHKGNLLNPVTGAKEGNGTLILDVSDPRNPTTLHHIPGDRRDPAKTSQAQMVRACDIGGRTFLLRSSDRTRHEIWDVTDPKRPVFTSLVLDGLKDTHKNWWECDTGIAYIVGGDPAWRTDRMTKVFDLKDPKEPVFIRDFGLVGQQPGSTMDPPPRMLHGPIALGNRVYFAYGATRGGILQIVNREKLLNGDPQPTPENLLYPQVSRLDMGPLWGGHTSFPVLGLEIADYQDNTLGRVRDFVVLVGESFVNECQESQQATFMVDITEETTPFSVANFQVPESSGGFCRQGGRFGPHSMNESFTPTYYKKIVFISYFNAGVRAVDIRDPFQPKEIGFFIPAITEKTKPTCRMIDGNPRCKLAIQTNNVEVDDRGFIYIVDRASTGLHLLELTGSARDIAQLP